jgi:hypothetical protein
VAFEFVLDDHDGKYKHQNVQQQQQLQSQLQLQQRSAHMFTWITPTAEPLETKPLFTRMVLRKKKNANMLPCARDSQ